MKTTIDQENSSRWLTIVILISGTIFFVIHFILSWYWFKERMMQYDTPFYVIKLIQQQKIIYEHDRYSTFFIQLLPCLVMKAGGSLEMISRSYSVAADIFYFSLFLISILVLKNNAGAVLLLLFVCLVLGRDYFLPVGEYTHAIITSTLLFGIHFNDAANRKMRLFFASLILICSLDFHPIGAFAVALILIFGFFENKKEERIFWVLLAFVGLICFLIRIRLSLQDDYENNKMGSWLNFADAVFHPGQLKSLIAVIKYFTANSIQLIYLFFLSASFLVWRKKWGLLTFNIAYIFFALILFSTVIGKDETHILFGGYFILIGLPVLIPTIQFLFSKKNNFALLATIGISILTFIYQVQNIHLCFAKRIEFVKRVIQNGKHFPEKRYIVDIKNYPDILWGSRWTLPFQTLLLSSLENPDSAMTCIVAPEINAYDSLTSTPAYFLGPEWFIDMFNFKDNQLRKQYFNLPEAGYRKLTTTQRNFFVPDSVFNSSSVSLFPMEPVIYASSDSVYFSSVRIINSTNATIPAIPDNVNSTFLSYHIKDATGNLVAMNNLKTPLEADVYGNNINGLNILTRGLEKGIYTVEPDLLTENEKWWGIHSPIKLVVK
ncbi:MAG: hypothetical protein ABI763_08040 [Bacteroidota bacterium]